jgi:transposase
VGSLLFHAQSTRCNPFCFQGSPRPSAVSIDPVIPPKANRLEIIVYDKEQYKQQNKVEWLFNKMKQFRRIATRYEKLK